MKYILFISMMTMAIAPFCQEKIVSPNYYQTINDGIYKTQSLNKIYLKGDTIKAQKNIPSFNKNVGQLLINKQPIILFKNAEPSSENDVSGILYESSIILVEEVQYRGIYKDPNVNWKVTFDVWYKIKINEYTYYTDYQIHDFIAFKKIFLH